MAKGTGTSYALYLGTTAPTSAVDEADANYDVVSYSKSLDISFSTNVIDESDKDSSTFREVTAGRRSGTINWSGHLDLADDAGQAAAIDTILAATNSVYWLISDAVTGNELYHGQGVIGQTGVTYPDDAMAELSLTIECDGTITKATGA